MKGRTDGLATHEETNSCFSQFCKRIQKLDNSGLGNYLVVILNLCLFICHPKPPPSSSKITSSGQPTRGVPPACGLSGVLTTGLVTKQILVPRKWTGLLVRLKQ